MKFLKSLKAKLSSRKLWSAVVGVAVALSAMFGLDEMTTGQITALISAIGVLVAYIFAEAQVDSAKITKSEENENTQIIKDSATQKDQLSLFDDTENE